MKKLIAKKNDELRAQLPNLPDPHKLVLSEGVNAMGMVGINRLIEGVRTFNDFNEDNDPYGEHDCIIIQQDGKTYICKIDYYDSTFEGYEENGNRVFTIMQGSEY